MEFEPEHTDDMRQRPRRRTTARLRLLFAMLCSCVFVTAWVPWALPSALHERLGMLLLCGLLGFCDASPGSAVVCWPIVG